MASNPAGTDSKEDFSSCPLPVLPSQFTAFSETEISTILKTSIQSLSSDVGELKQRVVAVEASCEQVQEKQDDLQAAVVEASCEQEEKQDKLQEAAVEASCDQEEKQVELQVVVVEASCGQEEKQDELQVAAVEASCGQEEKQDELQVAAVEASCGQEEKQDELQVAAVEASCGQAQEKQNELQVAAVEHLDSELAEKGIAQSTDADRSSGDEDEVMEAFQAVQEECTKQLKSADFIMEPIVYDVMGRFLRNGGAPDTVMKLLSDNYTGVAQTVNILAEWLIQSGVDLSEVKDTVETHLKEMILKHFDPKKADSVFYQDEQGTDMTQWLRQMIQYPTWRSLFYKLADDYEDCFFLNLAIKFISDAGYQGEITSVSTACHQIEVFSRVLRTFISGFLEGGDEVFEKQLPEFTKMVCHGEHTYLYCQILMNSLANTQHGCTNIRRLCQELEKRATEKGLDVTPITLALSGASAYPGAHHALSSMLSRKALNPADMTQLYNMYSEQDPPPVDLIRVPAFLDLLVETLFKPGSHVNPAHEPKYTFLLAYAVSVFETVKKGNRRTVNKEELKHTNQALDKTRELCQKHKGASDLIADIGTLFGYLKLPVCAMGVLRWVDYTVSEPSYFKLNTDHTPLHLVLVDEIGTNHPLLHSKALDLLVRLFESSYDELDVLVRLELKKMLLDRMVHLLSRGSAIPVVTYVRKCYEQQDTDISLIRHFVSELLKWRLERKYYNAQLMPSDTGCIMWLPVLRKERWGWGPLIFEVLDVITPPYNPEFVQLFLPLIENELITGYIRTEASKAGQGATDPVTEFIRAST